MFGVGIRPKFGLWVDFCLSCLIDLFLLLCFRSGLIIFLCFLYCLVSNYDVIWLWFTYIFWFIGLWETLEWVCWLRVCFCFNVWCCWVVVCCIGFAFAGCGLLVALNLGFDSWGFVFDLIVLVVWWLVLIVGCVYLLFNWLFRVFVLIASVFVVLPTIGVCLFSWWMLFGGWLVYCITLLCLDFSVGCLFSVGLFCFAHCLIMVITEFSLLFEIAVGLCLRVEFFVVGFWLVCGFSSVFSCCLLVFCLLFWSDCLLLLRFGYLLVVYV